MISSVKFEWVKNCEDWMIARARVDSSFFNSQCANSSVSHRKKKSFHWIDRDESRRQSTIIVIIIVVLMWLLIVGTNLEQCDDNESKRSRTKDWINFLRRFSLSYQPDQVTSHSSISFQPQSLLTIHTSSYPICKCYSS